MAATATASCFELILSTDEAREKYPINSAGVLYEQNTTLQYISPGFD